MALILSRTDVQRCFTMTEAIEAMRVAFSALQQRNAQMPQRSSVALPEQGVALCMPSLLHLSEQQSLGLKVVTIVPRNLTQGLPLIYASVLLLDALTGKTLAILEGGWLTAMRTGAAAGLATDLLARRDADVLALFGAGGQAPTQVMAIHAVRPLREVRVFNRSKEHYQNLVSTLQILLGSDCPVLRHVGSAREALEGALLASCATTATTPLFSWKDIARGAHINAIGAYTPAMCEVDAETLAHAHVVVDQREAALTEAGDLLQALEAGKIGDATTWQELGEVVFNKQVVRRSDEEITVFKSVGLGVQDVAAAWYVYKKAREMGLGVEVEV
ncbi:ornithine cyclodeaminase family protein [Ktedonosporobacter rubrisoli]|uniref:Ornithine cyclodeaminase family protein n=1 Tax=Ktedonosporobacter rubrisoli TaxID=2509675 RepID=A0A4P6JS44_KTERU|nr:ornithine cyclodeaminase family protein [Ktedonosporobacter rubrisoli]QBD78030.1 ornithine cyclodeaminase family protein [Ktedonosporobacter rubrisoli]